MKRESCAKVMNTVYKLLYYISLLSTVTFLIRSILLILMQGFIFFIWKCKLHPGSNVDEYLYNFVRSDFAFKIDSYCMLYSRILYYSCTFICTVFKGLCWKLCSHLLNSGIEIEWSSIIYDLRDLLEKVLLSMLKTVLLRSLKLITNSYTVYLQYISHEFLNSIINKSTEQSSSRTQRLYLKFQVDLTELSIQQNSFVYELLYNTLLYPNL